MDDEVPETPEAPETRESVAESSAPAPPPAPQKHRTRRWGLVVLLLVLLLPALVFGAWSWITLNYSYSKGERAGYVQKISQKGWLCKTWEGELAMANLPGTMPETFAFSVRNDSIARVIEENVGKRVALTYEQHRGVPTSCFAETEYYITNVRLVDK
jgi:hypothetical protein